MASRAKPRISADFVYLSRVVSHLPTHTEPDDKWNGALPHVPQRP
jgi:hypothetical protein